MLLVSRAPMQSAFSIVEMAETRAAGRQNCASKRGSVDRLASVAPCSRDP